jgi:hypothetical protein
MIKELDETEIKNTYAWSRYLYRTIKIKTKADQELSKPRKKDSVFPNEMQVLYFALLHVTIEAFRTYKFSDERIEYLMGGNFSKNLKLLYGLRNSVFHPDPSVKFDREIVLLENADHIIPWAYLLTDEFERYLFFYPERNGFEGEAADILRKEIRAVNCWLPSSSLMIKKKMAIDHLLKSQKTVKRNYPDKIDEFNLLAINLLKVVISTPNSFKEDMFHE